MKLTLRKANALQNAIQDHVKTIDISTTVKLNEFQNPIEVLPNAMTTLVQNDARRSELTEVLYKIRASVGRANVESGVSDLLARAAFVDKRLAQLKGLTEAATQESLTVLEGRLGKMRNEEGKSRIYGYNDTIESGVMLEQIVETYRIEVRNLKKEKQSINDKVLELNVRTEIELDEGTVKVLTSEQLV